MSLMDGDAVAAGVDARAWGGHVMQQGGCYEGPGNGVWERHLDRCFALEMWEMGT